MKVVILAGGLGTRISEETDSKPKPMVEIGGKPILWHIMKIYSHYGFNDFVICLGYKGYIIKEFFFNYYKHMSDFTINLSNNELQIHASRAEKWKVSLVDTGVNVMTGARIKKIQNFLDKDKSFCLTYGDGVSDVDINKLVNFHANNNKLATLTAVKPAGRFGALDINENNTIVSFKEKPKGDGSRINGGFFVLSSKIFNYLNDDDSLVWEQEPLMNLAKDHQLGAFKHDGFWQPMDTLRDKNYLEELWTKGNAPWKVWK